MSTQQPQQQEMPPESMLEIYMHVIGEKPDDPFLDQINLGTGFYDNMMMYLQEQDFINGMYAESAMTRLLMERARFETKLAIVDAFWDRPRSKELLQIEFPDPKFLTREEYFDEYGDDIWENLGTPEVSTIQHQAMLVHRYTRIAQDWVPPHLRFVKMRHKASQSKGARALDNLFERVKEFAGMNNEIQEPGE